MSQRVGLVLAGGRSRRLGRAKGELLYRGQSLAERAANALWPLCSSVLISIGRGASNPAPGFATVEVFNRQGSDTGVLYPHRDADRIRDVD